MCATDLRNGDVAGHLLMRHAIGKHSGGLPPDPRSSSRRAPGARGRSAPKMVVLGQEVERPPGVFHGAGHIAASQGI